MLLLAIYIDHRATISSQMVVYILVQVAAHQLERTGKVSQYQAVKGVTGTMGLLLSIDT